MSARHAYAYTVVPSAASIRHRLPQSTVPLKTPDFCNSASTSLEASFSNVASEGMRSTKLPKTTLVSSSPLWLSCAWASAAPAIPQDMHATAHSTAKKSASQPRAEPRARVQLFSQQARPRAFTLIPPFFLSVPLPSTPCKRRYRNITPSTGPYASPYNPAGLLF